ncbi:hypothetical protein SAMN05428984_4516 [Sphingomonas sp. OK281]|nr:hypothetical protein SAMN05428984_4516 [Sphingomonas sp. OK281]
MSVLDALSLQVSSPAHHAGLGIYAYLALGALGSGLIGHSQKMTVAASATADKKTVGQRS